MKKSIFEQRGGTYTQVEDYLLPNLTLPEDEQKLIGIWGQRHARHLKQHYKILYMNLLTSGKLNAYLADIDAQAEDMFFRLVTEMAKKQDITEQLKSNDPMMWVGKMNAIRIAVAETVINGGRRLLLPLLSMLTKQYQYSSFERVTEKSPCIFEITSIPESICPREISPFELRKSL